MMKPFESCYFIIHNLLTTFSGDFIVASILIQPNNLLSSILITVQWIQGHFTLTNIEAGLGLYILTPTGIGRVFQAGSVSELDSV